MEGLFKSVVTIFPNYKLHLQCSIYCPMLWLHVPLAIYRRILSLVERTNYSTIVNKEPGTHIVCYTHSLYVHSDLIHIRNIFFIRTCFKQLFL